MRAVFTIAGLTIREAVRRRITVGGFVIVLLFLGLLYVVQTHGRPGRRVELEPHVQAAMLAYFGLALIKFFSAVLGIALASGAVSSELERGTLYAILSKPLHRFVIIAGKWLGLVVIVLTNFVIWSALIWWGVQMRDPGPHLAVAKAMALAAVYPLIFLTLALWFSTFVSAALGTALCVIAVGIGWQEGLLFRLGEIFELEMLQDFSLAASYAVPIGRLHRWVMQTAELPLPFGVMGGPLADARPPVSSDLAYIAFYVLGVFVLALFTFQRRDV
jgi:ABC-type transport system involved in multi-copper enzyme maturation permease subunit